MPKMLFFSSMNIQNSIKLMADFTVGCAQQSNLLYFELLITRFSYPKIQRQIILLTDAKNSPDKVSEKFFNARRLSAIRVFLERDTRFELAKYCIFVYYRITTRPIHGAFVLAVYYLFTMSCTFYFSRHSGSIRFSFQRIPIDIRHRQRRL